VGLSPESAVLGPQYVAIVQLEEGSPDDAGPPDGEDVADPP
jgi:hypothetical protein